VSPEPAANDYCSLPRPGIACLQYNVIELSRHAEFPAYARVCLWIELIFGGCAVLVEHNVEFERIRDQVADLSNPGVDLHTRCR